MGRECYTYLIGWQKHNLFYYGVRFARNCHPDDLWVSYFTSSSHVKAQRERFGDPDLIQVRKKFGDNPEAAKLWEDKVLRRLKVADKPQWLNKYNGTFLGFRKVWNDGLTKDTSPLLWKISKKISLKAKGKVASLKARESMRRSASKRRHLNSWGQLRSNSELYNRFSSYEEFVFEVLEEYVKCWRIPLKIAEKLNVTEKGVKSVLSFRGLSFMKSQVASKAFNKYGGKFSSYEDLLIKVLLMHFRGYSPNQIKTGLEVNDWIVCSTLKRLSLVANRGKTGPSSPMFKEVLIADALEIMSSTYTLENNPLPESIRIKLRNSISHGYNVFNGQPADGAHINDGNMVNPELIT